LRNFSRNRFGSTYAGPTSHELVQYACTPRENNSGPAGWLALLHQLDAKLQERWPDYTIAQIKEKFGTLRIYCYGEDEYIQGVIRMAEEMSAITCEVTGLPGQMCRKGYWYRTLSKDQAALDGYEVCSEKEEESVEGD
jgi:hypothetical protein